MNWRALLAGGVFIALLIAAVLIARRNEPVVEVVPPAARQPARQPVQPVPTSPASPLDRADLIDAAARAADAHARGAGTAPEDSDLVGRRFTIRLPFGCTGPAEANSEAPLGWTYDPAEETLRVWVTPRVWTDATPVRAAAEGIEFEAAEGFWIQRPWLRSGDCPALPQRIGVTAPAAGSADGEETSAPANEGPATAVDATEDAIAPIRETLALVELFEPGSRRAARRNGRPYTVVTKLAPDEVDLSKGLRVVVSGQLTRLGRNAPIACSGTLIDERPLCVIGAEIDRVAITDASGRRVLGEWGS